MISSKKAGTDLAVLVLDIDWFKTLNDSSGHDAGDVCLRCVADAIASETRSSDLCVRYGGGEFLLLMLRAGLPEAAAAAERIRKIVEDLRIPRDGRRPSEVITVSVSVALGRAPESSVAALIGHSDRAMYIAREVEKNAFRPLQITSKPTCRSRD